MEVFFFEAMRGNFSVTLHQMKFSIKDFLSKCDQIRRKLQIWSQLLKESLMENFIFCTVKCEWSYTLQRPSQETWNI